MSAVTAVTLMNGRTIEVAMSYEDATAFLASAEKREVTLTCGERLTLATALVGTIESVAATTKAPFGFSRALA